MRGDSQSRDAKSAETSQHNVLAAADEREQAVSRAVQIKDHLQSTAAETVPPNGRRRRRESKRKQVDDLPADYSDVLEHLQKLKELAATPDTTKTGYIRQKETGKLWVRERIEQLLDRNSFREIGSITGAVTWKKTGPSREQPESFTPSNNVQGFGTLDGRRILFTADDFSIRAGHADGALSAKTVYVEKLALELKIPIVKLVDGSSGGGSVTFIRKHGYSYVPPMDGGHAVIAQLNAGIPNLGAGVGAAIGLGAARLVACHFSVMAADIGSLFNAGPKVVVGATFEEGLSLTDLGGPSIHCTNGTIDNLAANEAECFAQIRRVLSYLPNCGTQVPPTINTEDPANRTSPELRTIIPRRRERMYNPRKLIGFVVDGDSFFEIGALWGRTAIVGLARLGGRPIGIICNNCEHLGGAIDSGGAQKMTRHLKFCDVFNLPILQFVDVPGYAIGTVAERTATMRWGVELWKTYYTTTIPIFNVIVRKTYGVAGAVMVECRDPHTRVGWPSMESGSLPLDGGIDVGHAGELRKIEQQEGKEARKTKYKELEEEYRRLINPIRTANHFSIEEIIDPADTRGLASAWCEMMYDSVLPQRVIKRVSGLLKPQFA